MSKQRPGALMRLLENAMTEVSPDRPFGHDPEMMSAGQVAGRSGEADRQQGIPLIQARLLQATCSLVTARDGVVA